MIDYSLPLPSALGLPSKFSSWRQDQEHAISDFINSSSRFNVYIMPTGSGKSLVYMTSALLSSGRSLVLTSTKGLQKQIETDFGGLSLVKVMGKNAYKCKFLPDVTCDMGICNYGVKCMYKDFGCLYYDKIREAERADIVVTNYSFWLNHDPDNPLIKYTIGHFDTLICDESHNSVNHLLDALSVHLTKKRVERLGFEWPGKASDDDLWEFIEMMCDEISGEIEQIKKSPEKLARALTNKDFMAKCKFEREVSSRIAGADKNSWVVECSGYELTYDPIWPSGFAEEMLFRGVPKVLMTSATVNEKIMNFLGVFSDMNVKEYPSRFPIERRPIYMLDIPPTLRVDFRMTNELYKLWISRIDQLIRPRQDRNGIIHTVSYDRCQRIVKCSDYADFFLTHDRNSKATSEAVRMFKCSEPPTVLVSPSMVTGWDFPGCSCEYQIIAKVPFPDMRRKVDKARKEIDPEYGMCYAMLNLVQACGRGMRAEDDQCECFIVDAHFKWFVRKYAKFAPKWFLDAIKTVGIMPDPLQKMRRRKEEG